MQTTVIEDSTGQSGSAATNGRKAQTVGGDSTSGLACFSSMQDGYVKVWRKIWENPSSKNPNWISLWIWMLHRAEWQSGRKVRFKGQTIVLKAGQFTAGRGQIASATGVHPMNIQRLLQKMRTEQQIEQQTSNLCSLFTITNWSQYQSCEQPTASQLNSQPTAKVSELNTKEEEKNIRRQEVQTPKVVCAKRFVPPTKEEAVLYSSKIGLPESEVDRFIAYYTSNGWRVGKNPMRCWQSAMVNWRKNWEERRQPNNRPYPVVPMTPIEAQIDREARAQAAARKKWIAEQEAEFASRGIKI